MAEPFKTRSEIQAWLETQPPDVILIFGARAALRSLPRLIRLLNNKKMSLFALSLSCFRATSVSLSSGRWAAQSEKLRKTAAAADTAAADTAAHYYDDAYDAATHAAAAYAAAYAADAAGYAIDADNAADAATHAATYATTHDTHDAFFGECSLDRDFINAGNKGQDLAKTPLWSDTTSETYKNLTENWRNLKTQFLAEDRNWWVWMDWYEDRLRGNAERPFTLPFVEEVEIGADFENGQYGRCTLPEEFYKDPAKANSAIAEIIEGYWARQEALKQDVTVETFGPNAEGIIDRTTAQTSPGLTDTPEQRDWYESLRDAALGMKDIGENALGRAARPVNNLLNAMPKDMAEAKIAKLWPAANRIRKLKAAHDRAAAGPDDYHPNLLGSEVIDDVDQFVEVYNNFTLGDAGLSEKDRNTAGPQDPEAEVEASEAATAAIKIAVEHELFTDNAAVVLADTISESQEIDAEVSKGVATHVLDNLARDNIRREKENALRAIILRVRESEKYGIIRDSTLKAIGPAIIKAISLGMFFLFALTSGLFG